MATFISQYNINKKYVECPYNSNHKIPSNRMPIHLIKCSKQSALNLMVCPFNAKHRLPKDKYTQHLNICKDQIHLINPSANNAFQSVHNQKTVRDGRQLPTEQVVKNKEEVKPNDDSENWD